MTAFIAPPTGSTFKDIPSAVAATRAWRDINTPYYVVAGRAVFFARTPSSIAFIGYLAVGEFERLPITCVDHEGNPISFDEYCAQENALEAILY